MKPFLKLVFVALLIGVALEMPTKVRASGGNYICSSPGYLQCESSAVEWMGQCAYGCTYGHGGQSTQMCYNTNYNGCLVNPPPPPPGQQTCTAYSSNYQTCDNVPSSSTSCMSECIDVINEDLAACTSNYCTLE